MHINKGIIALLLLFLITNVQFTYSNAAAGDSGSIAPIGLDEAIERALNNNHRIKILDRTIDEMWENHVKLTDASKAIQDQLDHMENYTRLYNKLHKNNEQLTFEETQQYSMYLMMYGATPPEMSSEELFYGYIKNRDFPHYSFWASIKNTKTNRDLMESNITLAIRQLFENILNIQDTLELQNELLESMENQNRQIHLKFENGLVSEYDKYLSDTNLVKQKINIAKLQRSLDNVKMSLKQQIGIPLGQEIELTPYDTVDFSKPLDNYESYLEKAMSNRSEVSIAKIDLQVKQRELDIIKQYIKNELLFDRWDAQQSYDEKKMIYDETVEKVRSDIYDAYKAVLRKRDEVKIAETKKGNAETQYNRAKRLFDAGLIGSNDLMAMEIALYQEKIALNQSMRDYSFNLYRLELACGIGPGYNSGMGGN